MHFTLRAQGVDVNEALRQEIERRLMFALDRQRPQLVQVSVFVADLNGPRGGVDKLCQVSAAVKGRTPLSALERSTNLLSGLSRAARRLARRIDASSKSRRALRSRVIRAGRAAAGG